MDTLVGLDQEQKNCLQDMVTKYMSYGKTEALSVANAFTGTAKDQIIMAFNKRIQLLK